MALGKILIKPSFSKLGTYHGPEPEDSEGKFGCSQCGADVVFNLAPFAAQGWGVDKSLPQELERELSRIFDVPIVGRSHDGGFPSYRLVACPSCGSKYVVYSGVDETSNSVWKITVQGIVEYDA